MTDTRFDLIAIGNAIVDVIARADDAFVEREGVAKGSMRLIDAATAVDLYDRMGPAIETSGGSAANTVAGAALLGARCGFIGQIADDQLGAVFAHDIRAQGVAFETPILPGGEPTGRCLILVTPDGQRTMNTALGVSQFLPAAAIDRDMIAGASILYLEGYLWDPAEPRAAMRAAIDIARGAGRKVAFTLSDVFCIHRHGGDFRAMAADGLIDIMFANESELRALAEIDDLEAAMAKIAAQVPLLVVTCSEKGAIAIHGGERFEVAAQPVDKVVDTTGAGDLFAAGFLAGHIESKPVGACLAMGAIAAAEVISHYGPRPEADLKALVAARFG